MIKFGNKEIILKTGDTGRPELTLKSWLGRKEFVDIIQY